MQPAYDRMQEVAGCSSMHAACMQPACSLHYASSVAASIEIHVHIPGVDAVCRASTPCIPGSTPCTPASTPCMQPACRLHAGRRRQENTPRMNMLILGVFFRAYFSIFSLWQHVVMSSRCHLRRTWPAAGTSWSLFTSASKKNGESASEFRCSWFHKTSLWKPTVVG